MPILNKVAQIAVKPFQGTISPKSHAALDYVIIGSLLASAGWFWSRNKRAALAALICGGAQLGLNLLTEYGEGRKPIGFRTHREIERGLGAMTATMPEFLGFKDSREKTLFQIQGVITTVLAELTDDGRKPAYRYSRRPSAA